MANHLTEKAVGECSFLFHLFASLPEKNLDIDVTSRFPEQRLTRLEALRGMTIDPAYASFTEDTLGSLEVGKRADFVVLDRDIMEVRAEEIMDTKVLATILDGAAVFGSL